MSIKSFPFTSVSGDRKITASDFRQYWAAFATNGIVRGLRNECKCTVGGMTVNIAVGIAHIEGALAIIDSPESVVVSSTSSRRYCTIVLEFNNNSAYRNITAKALYSSSEPTLTQNSVIWQLPLCTFIIPANATTLSDADIVDRRVWVERQGTPDATKTVKYYDMVTKASDGYYLGDVDKNGSISNTDVMTLTQYLAGSISASVISTAAADLDGDGVVSNADLIELSDLVNRKRSNQVIARVTTYYTDGTKSVKFATIDK